MARMLAFIARCASFPRTPTVISRVTVVEKIVVLAQPDTTLFFTSPATPEG